MSHYRLADSIQFLYMGDKNQLNGGLFDNYTYNIAGTTGTVFLVRKPMSNFVHSVFSGLHKLSLLNYISWSVLLK